MIANIWRHPISTLTHLIPLLWTLLVYALENRDLDRLHLAGGMIFLIWGALKTDVKE